MTKRNYPSVAPSGKIGMASAWKKLEMQKGGALPMSKSEQYQQMIKNKIADRKYQLSKHSDYGSSPTAQATMKQMMDKHISKRNKAVRQMVVIKPQFFPGAGHMDKKGNIYDLGNNLTMKVNIKTGEIKSMGGMTIAKYQRGSAMMNGQVGEYLKKNGKFFLHQIHLKKMDEWHHTIKNAGGVHGSAGDNSQMAMHGGMAAHDAHGNAMGDTSQIDAIEARRGSGMSAFGGVSNNVHGTFSENVWGTMSDNVWGTTSSDVWGNTARESLFGGGSSWRLFGKAIQPLLKPLGGLFAGFNRGQAAPKTAAKANIRRMGRR